MTMDSCWWLIERMVGKISEMVDRIWIGLMCSSDFTLIAREYQITLACFAQCSRESLTTKCYCNDGGHNRNDDAHCPYYYACFPPS